jgi:hypothetical protein
MGFNSGFKGLISVGFRYKYIVITLNLSVLRMSGSVSSVVTKLMSEVIRSEGRLQFVLFKPLKNFR